MSFRRPGPGRPSSRTPRRRGLAAAAAAVLLAGLLPTIAPAAAGAADSPQPPAKATGFWTALKGKPATTRNGHPAEVRAKKVADFSLDRTGLRQALSSAPLEQTRAARRDPLVVALPAPDGTLQRFALQESPVMEPGLAARHPEITTYAGTGLDDPTARVRADLTPLGFHASVLSPGGAWYVDPLYRGDQSVYASYYGGDLVNRDGAFVEREDVAATAAALHDEVAAAADVAEGPAVQLRTYRLALVTDPSYATYFGGPANVTAAKVTLVNRVTQIYEDEMAVRLVLIDDTDKTNLDTAALATAANGPCGTAPCFTTAQLAAGCTGTLLQRNRIALGQLVGASNYDIGHIGLGINGGGVASLNAVGGNAKAQGCTGLPTPVGDFFAVDYVAHEMGHQFGGNHTFNGTRSNCGGNKAAPSVEPGSGSSIMAYAGICQQDNLQPHSDPYWSQWSFQEITAYITSVRPPINEVETVSLRGFDTNGDAFALGYDGKKSAPLVRGANYNQAAVQVALQGPSDQQQVALTGYDADGDSYRLSYGGSQTVPIVRGQNDTVAGVQAALQGGNEQQQVALTGFNPATGSYRVKIGDATSALIGLGGVTPSNANIAAAVNAIAGFAGTVSSASASNAGFTLTFGGASAATDVPAVSIVECTCTSTVREVAKGGPALGSWPAGATVTTGTVSDAGYLLTFSGSLQGSNVADLSVTDGTGDVAGTVIETVKGGLGLLPLGATAVVAGWGGTGVADDLGFQVTFGGVLAGVDVASVQLVDLVGADGFVGETATGGPIDNAGNVVTDTGNHAPVVTTPAEFVIPVRTPFALTGSATDPDGDSALTYMWEQKDRGGGNGTALTDNNKVNGPLFRQFGTAANVTPEGTLQTPSPGLNAAGTDPPRVFPDLEQVLVNNTNADTGVCPAVDPNPAPISPAARDCYSEFLPTSAYVGVAGVNAAPPSLNFRLTVRDGRPGGGGVGSSDTRLVLAPAIGPFRVTSQTGAAVDAGTTQQVTWDVAGTDQAPVSTSAVRISLSTDGGRTYPHVLAASTPNDGAAPVTMPNLDTDTARIKVEALGNVYFDVSPADFSVRGVADQLQDLVNASRGVGPGSSLFDKASAAQTAFAGGGITTSCGALADYLSQVKAQSGKKIPAATAAALTTLATRIRLLMSC